MMKFALMFVLVGLAVAGEFNWEQVPLAGNATQCMYRPDHKVLGCRGLERVVECGVEGQLPRGFEVFGLGRESVEETPVESVSYWLYPRELNQTVYENHVVEESNTTHNVSLFHLESLLTSTVGLRVPDVKCWSRIVELLNATVETHSVEVEGMSTQVTLVSEVLVTDKSAKKRFLLPLLGLRLAMAAPLFGWGLGWGLPLFPLLG